MKARRLGANLPLPLKCAAKNAELDPSGAYLLGQEMCHLGRHDEAYLYLIAAGNSADMPVAPSAARFLADPLSYGRPKDRDLIRNGTAVRHLSEIPTSRPHFVRLAMQKVHRKRLRFVLDCNWGVYMHSLPLQ